MAPTRTLKEKNDRISECLAILKKIINELQIDRNNPSILLLKKRMLTYWEDGKLQEDRIPLLGSNRYILYRFPQWSHQIVEITLRAGRIHHERLSPELLAELTPQSSVPPDHSEVAEDGTHSVTQSDP
jgi:hypothetical protein